MPCSRILCLSIQRKTQVHTHTKSTYRPGMGAGVFKLLHDAQRLMGCGSDTSVVWLSSISETMPLYSPLSFSFLRSPRPLAALPPWPPLSSSSSSLIPCCREDEGTKRYHSVANFWRVKKSMVCKYSQINTICFCFDCYITLSQPAEVLIKTAADITVTHV